MEFLGAKPKFMGNQTKFREFKLITGDRPIRRAIVLDIFISAITYYNKDRRDLSVWV